MPPLILLGFMGSGKSTVGRALAKRLGLPFYDLDEEIEKRTGMKIPDLFRNYGEAGFRSEETRVLRELVEDLRVLLGKGRSFVLALGGGAPVREENWELLSSLGGLTIWLDLPAELAFKRVEGSDRPLIKGADPYQEFRKLFQSRKRFYQRATLRLEAAKPVASIVEEILCKLKEGGELPFSFSTPHPQT